MDRIKIYKSQLKLYNYEIRQRKLKQEFKSGSRK